jgi:glycosyltransferase involved in cell wall biosynthesis
VAPHRIDHVVATFPPYWAGTGNVAFHNAVELGRRGHRVRVYTADVPIGSYRDPAEVRVLRLPAVLRLGNAPLVPSLVSVVHDCDLVHLHWPWIFGAELTALACRLAGRPYVVTYHHDLRADLKWQFGPYQAVIGPLVLRGADRVLAVSLDYMRASPLYRYVRARGRDLIEVPNGVDTRQFSPDADGARVRAQLGIPADALVVGFVGAMDRAHPSRGVSLLIEAIARQRRDDVHLLAVGAGALQSEYRQHADRLGVGARCHWPGAVPYTGAELPAHFAAMDVVALPSLKAESFGMVLVEGMAVGRPVIGSDLPGVRSVVERGVDGFLVQPGDVGELAAAIDRLVGDGGLRARFGAAGRRKVESRYDWRAIAAQLERIYADVLGRP